MNNAREEGKNTLADRAFGGLLWQFSGTFGKGLLQVGFLSILARLITPEEFGIVSAALIVVGLSQLFGQFGVGPALVHQPELQDDHVRVGFSISVVLSVTAAAVVWFVAPWVAGFFQMPELEMVLVVLSLVFIVRGASVVPESLLQRELRFRELAFVDVVSYGIGYGLLGTTLGYFNYGHWALVAGHIGQSVLQSAGYLYMRPHLIWPSMNLPAARDLVEYGGGYTLLRLANYGAGQGDNVIVGRILGAEALGIYGRAYQLLVTPARLFGSVLDRVLFPTMAKIQENSELLLRTYRRAVSAVALLALPTSGLVLVVAPEVVLTLLGEQWREVIVPLQIFAVGILFRTSYKISDSLIRATGRVYSGAWRHGLYAVLVVVGAGTGSFWGVDGVASGVLLAIVAQFLLMAHLCFKVTGMGFKSFIAAHVPGLRLAVVTSTLGYGIAVILRIWEFPSMVVLGGTTFLLVVIVRNGLLQLWPKYFLGSDGLWVLQQANSSLPSQVTRLLTPPNLRCG